MSEELQKCPDTSEEIQSREALLLQLAQCLKEVRASKKISLEEAALSLKLRPVYLEALESGKWDEMPGEVYALGFLKQYAAFLGLDIGDSIEKLKTGDYKLTKPLTFPDPPIAPNRTWVIIAALAFVVLIILFNIFDSSEPEKSGMPAAETTEMQLAPEITPSDTVSAIEKVEPPVIESEQPVEEAPEVAVAEPVEHEYLLSAVGAEVWLQIYTDPSDGSAGVLVQEALLKDGESIAIHDASSLQLTCGNAAALRIEIDGHISSEAGSLGEPGKVLRNFRLAAE